ncbi:MAG: LPP20 family lipoprotein, partial [Bdellovibrionota bacterium]|nr:LPP20 family lipoprotein [Bdellovibrionota bacterium]
MLGIKKYCRTLFVVFLFGCSTAPKKVLEVPQKGKRPVWLSSPGTYCLNNELCAVGEGTGRLISESNARKELAKIFKVKIKSITRVSSFSESKTDENQVLSGSTEEDIFSQIQETSHEVLEGVVIKEVFEGEDSIYSLASLDKRKAGQILRSRMEQIDEKLKLFVKDGRRHLLSQCIDLLSVREGLNFRYEFLTGLKMKGPVTYKRVFNLKKGKASLGMTVS